MLERKNINVILIAKCYEWMNSKWKFPFIFRLPPKSTSSSSPPLVNELNSCYERQTLILENFKHYFYASVAKNKSKKSFPLEETN